MTRHAIALYSGGLDSILAIKLIQGQGIRVVAVFFGTPFFGFSVLRDPFSFKEFHLEKYGIEVEVVDYTDDLIGVLQNPTHGFGKHLNPCIDCKIGMLRRAGSMMDAYNASFVITGEVLGQRPMSQRRDAMNIIEKESGLSDLCVRPLCMQVLPETLPERMGVVDRSGLPGITGRGRKEQISMAKRLGIRAEDIPSPGGGCLLCENRIAFKVRHTLMNPPSGNVSRYDLAMDVLGRKFDLGKAKTLIVSRNDKENTVLSSLMYPGNIFIKIDDIPGPLGIIRGDVSPNDIQTAAGICLRYSKGRGSKGYKAVYGDDPMALNTHIDAPIISHEEIQGLRVDPDNLF